MTYKKKKVLHNINSFDTKCEETFKELFTGTDPASTGNLSKQSEGLGSIQQGPESNLFFLRFRSNHTLQNNMEVGQQNKDIKLQLWRQDL